MSSPSCSDWMLRGEDVFLPHQTRGREPVPVRFVGLVAGGRACPVAGGSQLAHRH
jgi:hypothetical protein